MPGEEPANCSWSKAVAVVATPLCGVGGGDDHGKSSPLQVPPTPNAAQRRGYNFCSPLFSFPLFKLLLTVASE